MTVNNRYKLGALVRTGVMATFEAQEVPSGRNLYLHLAAHSGSSVLELLDKVRGHLGSGRGAAVGPVVEMGVYDGTPFVVTEAKPELLDLKHWMDAHPPDEGFPVPRAVSPGEASDLRSTGEFTRMFRMSSEQATPAAPEPHGRGPGSGPPAAQRAAETRTDWGASEPPQQEPGEFTHLFSSSQTPSAPRQAEGQERSPFESSDGDSGSRRLSPEERRAEMRHYRMVTRSGSESVTPPAWETDAGSWPAKKFPPEAPAPPEIAPAEDPGEVTRLFQDIGRSPGGPGLPSQTPPSPPPAPPAPEGLKGQPSATQLSGPPMAPPAPPRAEPPGEFTRQFQSPEPRPPEQPYGGQPAAPPRGPGPQRGYPGFGDYPQGESRHANDPGQFTKQFGSAEPPAGAPPASPAAASSGTGEFTRLFGSRQTPAQQSEPRSPQPPPPPQPGTAGPGDFTRIFGGRSNAPRGGQPPEPPWTPGPVAPPPDQLNKPGEFTRLFGSRGGRKTTDLPTADIHPSARGATEMSREPLARPQASPPAPQGPGEYTRIAGGESPLPRQQAPPAPAAAPPAPPSPAPAAVQPATAPPAQKRNAESQPAGSADRSMYLILALVFCALLVVALGIVLFMTMTGASGEPQAAPSAAGAPAANPASGLAPRVTVPSATAPSVSAPSVAAPSLSGSGISSGSVSAPAVSQPSISTPSISAPSISAPGVSAPRLPTGQIPSAAAAPQPAGQAAQASPSSGTPYLALIIMLSVLLVIAVGAAVYFALRRA